jgi:hypothetical protein
MQLLISWISSIIISYQISRGKIIMMIIFVPNISILPWAEIIFNEKYQPHRAAISSKVQI